MSLRLDVATIAKIEADRIYDLILPEMEGKETVTVPLRVPRERADHGAEAGTFRTGLYPESAG